LKIKNYERFIENTFQIALHSPFEVPAENTPFFDIGVTDEIEASYNMLETV
jgi:hypothetical protein